MANDVTLVRASQDLTYAANAGNGETVKVGGKTYTYQTALTNVDGNVLIGATAEASIDNLVAAINLGAGAGTTYAAATTEQFDVTAAKQSATVLRVTARVPGLMGNHIDVAETLAAIGSAWGAANLASGSGDLIGWIRRLYAMNQINAEVLSELHTITPETE